ncbi:MAG: septum formation initiator family protein [Clostridia bacterium]|nr:septum formation initiator family protein [Clostridia bacterium]
MGISIENETYIFLAMVLLGAASGLLFDLFRVLRRLVSLRAGAVAITDFIFWIMTAILIFGGIVYINSGQLRWYEFIGLFIGILMYFLILSEKVIWVLIKVIEFLSYIFKIILTPLCFLYKILRESLLFVFQKVIRGFAYLKKLILMPMKRIWDIAVKGERGSVKKHRKKSGRKISLWGVGVFVLISFMLVKTFLEQPKIAENKRKIEQLNAQIEYEKKRAGEVDAMKYKVNTDEYIEKVARDKLGLIRENEKVFIDVSGQ